MVELNLLLHVHCDPCGRVVEIDLTKMPPEGKSVGVEFRCSQCGRNGAKIIGHKSAYRAVPGRGPKG